MIGHPALLDVFKVLKSSKGCTALCFLAHVDKTNLVANRREKRWSKQCTLRDSPHPCLPPCKHLVPEISSIAGPREQCKKPPIPRHSLSSPSKDAAWERQDPAAGVEGGKTEKLMPGVLRIRSEIILILLPKVGFVQHLGAIPFHMGSGRWARGPSGLAQAPAVPNPNIWGCLQSSLTSASSAQMDHEAFSASA